MGLASPLLNSNFAEISLSNTISFGSIVKVNRLIKKMLQNFGGILSMLFVICCL